MTSYVYLLAVLLLFNNKRSGVTQTHCIKQRRLSVTSKGGEVCGLGKAPLFGAVFFRAVDGVHCQLTTALRGPASLFEGQGMKEEKANQQQ